MTAADARHPGRYDGIFLSVLLAFVFLGGCAWWVLRELALVLPNHRVTASLSVETAFGTSLPWQIAAFAAAALAIHALLGLAAFGLARLTESAFPDGGIARRGWLIGGWLALLVGLVMAANTTWHPASIFAGEESWWRNEYYGWHPVQYAFALLAGLAGWIAWRASRRGGLRPRPRTAALAGVALAAVAVAWLLPQALTDSGAAPAADRPHLVIIGIDSLRSDLRVPRQGDAATPHIRGFLEGAHRFSDATTPLARTYPSWMSILTGRHPVTTNARYNLMPRRLVREGETLAEALRTQGYRAVYATDEVRFANFDESFGFQDMIMPPVGAVDFVLGFGGDMPLVNLVAPTRAGRWLFPSNHANRAAYVTYEPAQFLARLEDELAIEGPSFLAIHLTLAHWPYAWSGMAIPGKPPEYRDAYGQALEAVDAQFAAVMELLRARGVLDNAVVVLLSDHGEALGDDGDSMLRKTGTHQQVWETLWGHGTSVLSPRQYGVLLAMRPYGRAGLPGAAGDYDWPVSLEDLRPTLEEYATGRAPADVDGVSLLPFLDGRADRAALDARIRFTETDFNTPSTLAGRYEASGIIDEAHVYYELDPDSGWVQFREGWLPILHGRKQLAALTGDALLARVPDLRGGPVQYLYTDRHDPLPRRLEGRPDPQAEPEAARLWTALEQRFPGEFPGPDRLP